MIDKEKIEEWARQQVKYTQEILFLNDLIKEDEEEINVWRNEYIKMAEQATKWKKLYLELRKHK